jgi:hypothetical protein
MKKLAIGVPVAVLLVVGLLVTGLATRIIGGGTPSAGAMADIPPAYLALYQRAADTCPGLPWPVLAAIGKKETNHGRLNAAGVWSRANFAGAAGPMQFGIGGKAGNTWGGAPVRQVPPNLKYGMDGNGDGIANVYDPADAIFSAAGYLCANGGGQGGDLTRAIFAYNHADWYVSGVLAIASGYAAGGAAGLPSGPTVERAVAYAYSQLGKPYEWGATGEQGAFDCSGLTMAAYKAGGLQIPRTSREQWYAGARVSDPADLLPGDLVFYAYDLGDPSTIHHVGIYIGAGNMVDAPRRNTVIRIEPVLRGDYIGAVRPSAAAAPTSSTTPAASTTTTPADPARR